MKRAVSATFLVFYAAYFSFWPLATPATKGVPART
jgi:hypothetical protein